MSYVGVPLTRGRSATGGSAMCKWLVHELSSESEEQSVALATSRAGELSFECVNM